MLPALTAAFLLGLLFGSLSAFIPTFLALLLVCLAAGLTVLEQGSSIDPRKALMLYAALLTGVVYWALATPLPLPPHAPLNRRDIPFAQVSGRIVSPVQHAPNRQTVVVEADEALPAAEYGHDARRIKVAWREPGAVLLHGDRIQFRAKLHAPSGSLNPGGFDYAGYLERQGINAVTSITGPAAVHRLESGQASWRWAGWTQVDAWRAHIRAAAVHTLSQPALGIFLGIVIGERGYLQQDVQEWFMVTGTVHLLSISGSHLGLVAMVVFWMVRQAVIRLPTGMLLTLSPAITASRFAILVTWPMVTMYALLAGAELATIRSLVMITVAFVTVWIGHDRHVHHAMALAALLILLHDPRAMFDISFQLSFLSVLIIIQCVLWFTPSRPEEDQIPATGLQRVGAYGRDAVLMSGAVTMATLPVVAFYFNQVPWLGMFTNLVAIPLTGLLLVPLGLCTALWSVLTGAEDLAWGPLQERLFGWLVGGLRWCSQIPFGEWRVAAPALPAIVLFYAGLGVASMSGFSKRIRVGGAGVVVALVCLWMWSPRLGVDGDRWRVTFLDVGQGDSAVIELPDGQTVLIDGGAKYERFDMGRGVVAPFLWNRGIRHIDHVIGTHLQLDHVGGLAYVLRHLSVGQYWGTAVKRPEQFVAELQQALAEQGIQERQAMSGQELLPSGPCQLTIVNPAPVAGDGPLVHSTSGTALNNQSVVSRLECGGQSVLFAADIEVDGLRHLPGAGRTPVTVLKVPHHGAKSSLDREWIREIHPQHAVISVGQANSYGHPVQAVLQVYAEQQAELSRTDQDGAVWVTGRVSTGDLTVTRMRERVLEPLPLSRGLWRSEAKNWERLWVRFRDL
jgi:competence protein ComEC